MPANETKSAQSPIDLTTRRPLKFSSGWLWHNADHRLSSAQSQNDVCLDHLPSEVFDRLVGYIPRPGRVNELVRAYHTEEAAFAALKKATCKHNNVHDTLRPVVSDCPGWLKCHGPTSWCPDCGDVDLICDDPNCDNPYHARASEREANLRAAQLEYSRIEAELRAAGKELDAAERAYLRYHTGNPVMVCRVPTGKQPESAGSPGPGNCIAVEADHTRSDRDRSG